MSNAGSIASRYLHITSQVRRYFLFIHWLGRDALLRFKRTTIWALALSGLYLLFQLLALGLLSKYLHAVESGKEIRIADFIIVADKQSTALLLGTAAGCMILFFLSFVAKYYSETHMLRMWARYEGFCVERAVFLMGAYGGHPDNKPWRRQMKNLLNGDPRCCGLISRIALRLFTPAATWLATFAVLVYLDRVLTLVLVALVILCVPILYLASVRGASYAHRLEDILGPTRMAKRQKLREIVTKASDPASWSELRAAGQSQAASEPVRVHLHTQFLRRRSIEESRVVTGVLMGISIFAILLLKGGEIIQSGTGWAQLIAYLIILRINLNHITQAARLVASINRFYPLASRYMRFVLHMEGLARAGQAFPLESVDIPGNAGEGALFEEDDEDEDA